MRPLWTIIRRVKPQWISFPQRRGLLTLAIETSCDDTSVAVLEKHPNNSATIHFHSKVTSDNRAYGGVHPIIAQESHQKNIAGLVNEALQNLPIEDEHYTQSGGTILVRKKNSNDARKKPDFVTVTRGPGMRSNLFTGLDVAKGLAVAWQVPLLGVNHMQAHALTPRLVSALNLATVEETHSSVILPEFPFLSLLVSGGHTMLVHSRSLCDHEILANTSDIAIGDSIDKCARDILPASYLEGASDVMYGKLLESFAFPADSPHYKYIPPSSFMSPKNAAAQGYNWRINPPYTSPGPGGAQSYAKSFTFSGIGTSVRHIVDKRPDMPREERRVLAQVAMEVAFEHLASRVLFALGRPEIVGINDLVVSGGVASNRYLIAILRIILDARGHKSVKLNFPPPNLCTDNAAMIAWTGIEMFEDGWRTNLDAMAMRSWSIDPKAEDGGILGVNGWTRENAST